MKIILINLFLIVLIGVGVIFYCNKTIERAMYAGVISERMTMYDFIASKKDKGMRKYLISTIKMNIDILYHDESLRSMSNKMHLCEKIWYIRDNLLQDGVALNKLETICPSLKSYGGSD